MTRTDLINYLVVQRNANSYLEIGVHSEEVNFLHVRCAKKVATIAPVMPSMPDIYETFFEHNKEQFDIIFIDGLHTEEQALKDIGNACRSLAPDGLIVLHDCMPPDAWHQRELAEFREGENWNGTVWKAALKVFNHAKFKCTLLDTDWGCGIIDTAAIQLPKRRDLPEKLSFEQHYPMLLEYKKSVADYFREQVQVFYHLACMGNWQEVFDEQMHQLRQSGFQRVNISILGTEDDLNAIRSTCETLQLEINIIFHSSELTLFEKPALLAVEHHAQLHDGYTLYLHSKGVSNPSDDTKTKWRRLMMQELVVNWESCASQLPNYDAIGVNWREMPPTSHFCGNFWYASNKYLRKLPDFTHYYDNPLYKIWNPIPDKRFGCEFWIGSGNDTPNILSLSCKNADFCDFTYWKNR